MITKEQYDFFMNASFVCGKSTGYTDQSVFYIFAENLDKFVEEEVKIYLQREEYYTLLSHLNKISQVCVGDSIEFWRDVVKEKYLTQQLTEEIQSTKKPIRNRL